MRTQARPGTAARGVTLVEAAVTLTLLAILAGSALASIGALRERKAIEAVGAQFEADVHHAQVQALAQREPLHLAFGAPGGASCYVLYAGPAGACVCAAGGPRCAPGARPLRSEAQAANDPVQFTSSAPAVVFDGRRATVSPTVTLRVTGRQGRELRRVVNITGRVRSCTPAASMPGYPAC